MPIKFTKINISIAAQNRFWKGVHVKGEDECWPFGFRKIYPGQPLFNLGNLVIVLATRVMYILAYGSIPDDKPYVCHECDHPWCVNPKHFFAGTAKENVQDSLKKGRFNKATGKDHGFYTHPESRPTGERNGAHTHPEKWKRGDQHYMSKGLRLIPKDSKGKFTSSNK